jgi:hypothetical protein
LLPSVQHVNQNVKERKVDDRMSEGERKGGANEAAGSRDAQRNLGRTPAPKAIGRKNLKPKFKQGRKGRGE